MKVKTIALAVASLLSTTSIFAAEPTNQELLDILKKQQAQIEALQNKLNKTDQKIEQADEKIEASVAVIEENLTDNSTSKTSVGGYGELHYNNIDENEKVDFHRFVMFLDHEFSDKIRFYSELELEHSLSGDGTPGTVALEQAFIEIDVTESTKMQSGILLTPVGIINETHEPNTFYGVERNPVEKDIIPTTWREAGVAVETKFSEGFSGNFSIHSGFNVETVGSKSFLVRNGRQKVANANADSLAYTARLKYTAIPGLELASSYQIQDDITQGASSTRANLFSAHAIYNKGSFGIRALYAGWNIDGTEAEAVGRDKQSGYYIEPSYRLNHRWGLFARYNSWDNNAGDNNDTEKKQTNLGLNFWPHENVVFKLDIENRFGAQDGSGFNLGLGYQF